MISDKFGEQDIHIGDTLRVHSKVVEGTKSRIQVFEGILISLRGRGENRPGLFSSKTFSVRRIGAGGVGVERTWPLDSRSLVKIEVKKHALGVRRSKLYYLRNLTGRRTTRI